MSDLTARHTHEVRPLTNIDERDCVYLGQRGKHDLMRSRKRVATLMRFLAFSCTAAVTSPLVFILAGSIYKIIITLF